MSQSQNNMNKIKLAVLMTCYNRRDTTLACLHTLYQQNLAFDVYLVDDSSSDGTGDAVKLYYPAVKLFKGNGTLFWGGGMRLAFSEAIKVGYDHYIWLNDDIQLSLNALSHLLDTHHHLAEIGKPDSIVVGSLKDAVTGEISYGGRVRLKFWHPLNFGWREPSDEPLECDTMNGNCVLIPHSVVEKVGNIDEAFTHRRGDFDYGLRSRKLGCSVWVASGYVGTCSRNSISGTFMDANLTISQRLKKLDHPKELSSQQWKVYAKRHGGYLWFLYWLIPYIKLLLSAVLKRNI